MKNENYLIFLDFQEVEIEKEIEEKLNDLLSGLFEKVFERDVIRSFYNKIAEITGVRNLHNIRFLKNGDVQTNKIKQCLKWSKIKWQEVICQKDFRKSIVIYSIVDTFLDDSILDWEVLTSEYLESLLKILSRISHEINVPDDAPYYEKNLLSEYEEGVKTNDYKKIFDLIQALERGNRFESFSNIFHSSLLKISFHLNRKNFAEFLSTTNHLEVASTLKIITNMDLVEFFADSYEEKNVFPLLLFFYNSIHKIDHLLERKEIAEDKIFFEKYHVIFLKILNRIEKENPITYLMDLDRLSYSPVFHALCGMLAGNHQKYINNYVESLDFSLEKYFYGDWFYRKLLLSELKEDTKEDIYLKISEKYNAFLDLKDNGTHKINRLTGFFRILCSASMINMKNADDYAEKLYKLSEEIYEEISSWRFNHYNSKLSELYYLIVSNTYNEYEFNEKYIEKMMAILNDERFVPLIGEDIKNFLKQCLISPRSVERIKMIDDSYQEQYLEIRRNSKEQIEDKQENQKWPT